MKTQSPPATTTTGQRSFGGHPRPAILRKVRRAAVTALAAVLLAGAASPAPATADSGPAPKSTAGQDRPELQEAIQDFVDAGYAGLQMRVHDQRGNWVGSAGVRKLGEPARPPTNGRLWIGSTTKTFTATLVLQLVAESKIGLDAPVAGYLPNLGLDRRITVRMLLRHTSGLFNYTGDFYDGTYVPGIPGTGKEWVDNRFHTYQPEELIRLALSKPLTFAPGTGWNYTNTNYTLALLLIEKATGNSYAEEMRRRILGPLALRDTLVAGTRTPEQRAPTRPKPSCGCSHQFGSRRVATQMGTSYCQWPCCRSCRLQPRRSFRNMASRSWTGRLRHSQPRSSTL